MEADVNRDEGDAQCGKQLQHRRRQKGDAQYAQRALAKILDLGAQAARRQRHATQCAQRWQAAQAVEQKRIHTAHLQPLRFAGGTGAAAHDRHEHRDQRRRQQEHQRGSPGKPGDRQHDQRGHDARAPDGAAVTRQPGENRFGLFGQCTGGSAGMHPGAIQRRACCQRCDSTAAPAAQTFARRVEHAAGAPRFQYGAQNAGKDDACRRPYKIRDACAAVQA